MSGVLAELGLDEDELAALLDAFAARGTTVATAESLTAGLVCAALTCVAGASAVVRGGLIVYATELKAQLADVDVDLLAEHGAVHPRVAEELARGAARRCGADIGIGLTGVAGPSAQDGVPPGTVYIALANPHVGAQGMWVQRYVFSGEREQVRAAAVRAAIGQLGGILDGSGPGTTGTS